MDVRIPEGVREVIGQRLNGLSRACNRILTIASVIGKEFTLDELNNLIDDLAEDSILEALEEALLGGVVEELHHTAGRYQFTHGLIRETLAEELSTTRRVRLHAPIAQALETLYGAEADAHAAELAYHFGEAVMVLGDEKLVSYALVAGERALASYAWEEALGHFQRALAATEDQPPTTGSGQAMDGDTAALLFGLGRAHAAMLQTEEAQDYADTRFRLLR